VMTIMKMRKIINKQVHQVVIPNHPVVMKNEILVLARIPHHQTIIEMVLIVIIHQTKKNLIDMINHPLQAVIVDRIHHVVPNEMMHDDDQDLVHLLVHRIEINRKIIVINFD
jgi:hypothetical protein